MSLRRRLASVLYPTRIPLVDQLGGNADFQSLLTPLLVGCGQFSDRLQLYRAVQDTLPAGPIQYWEFGVWYGESLHAWRTMNTHPESRFLGFDTFTGLPETWAAHADKGQFFTAGGTAPTVDDPRVEFVVGLFQQTLHTALAKYDPSLPLVVHIDCDLYTSTLFVLSTLHPILSPGTLVIFDEMYDVLHEFAAWRDYTAAYRQHWRGIGSTTASEQVALRVATLGDWS